MAATTAVCPFETPPRTPPQIPMAPMKALPTPKYKGTPLLISGNQPLSPYLMSSTPSTPVDSEKGGAVWVSSLRRAEPITTDTEEAQSNNIFRAKSAIGEICPEDTRSLVEIFAQQAHEEAMSKDLESIVKHALGDNYY